MKLRNEVGACPRGVFIPKSWGFQVQSLVRIFLSLLLVVQNAFGALNCQLVHDKLAKARPILGITRESNLARLKNEEFDVVIIGGGATGAGAALDAASRGLKVALVEADDFASATSSRSTKLRHGGVRYLEAAFKKLDWGQFKLVFEALNERKHFADNAGYLSDPLPLVTPLYRWFDVPYFMAGLTIYGMLARSSELPGSSFLGKQKTLSLFPHLNPKGLKGSVLYYDGQFDDARMNVALAVSANEHGAAVANHTTVENLIKVDGKVAGVIARDNVTGERIGIRARTVINATGPFGDSIRKMDDPNAAPMIKASSGTHIVLDSKFIPPSHGILIPKTDDGRVLFILPWNGHTLVGTTDNKATVEANPKPSEADIDFILKQMAKYYTNPPSRSDVKSAWTGLRPLVSNPNATNTSAISRDHVVTTSDSGLVTISGGKWTTYRRMAQDAVDQAITTGGLNPSRPSQTRQTPVAGAEFHSPELVKALQKDYALPEDISKHLVHAYGDRSVRIAEIAKGGFSKRLSADHPFIEAEVIHAAKEEAARSTADVLARRARLFFVDQAAALDAIPRVSQLLGDTLGWNKEQRDADVAHAREYLK